MKIRLISRFGDGIPILLQMEDDGVEIDMEYAGPQPSGYMGYGMVDLAKGPMTDGLQWADMVGTCRNAFLSGQLNDSIEMDRCLSLRLAKAAGILIPNHVICKGSAEAVSHAEEALYSIRPLYGPAAYTLIPKNIEEQVVFVNDLPDSPVLLMEQLPGQDILFGCFYHNGEPILSTAHSAMELRRLYPGGPATGGIGSLAWFWKDAASKIENKTRSPVAKLWNATLGRMKNVLTRWKYSGILQARLRLVETPKEHPPYLLEFLAHPAYPTMQALMAVVPSVTDFFVATSGGRAMDMPSKFGGALRITIPPYPAVVSDKNVSSGKAISGVTNSFWPLDVFFDGKTIRTAGVDGAVGDVVATGNTPREVGISLEHKAENVILLDKQYRKHSTDDFVSRMHTLTEWKYMGTL